ERSTANATLHVSRSKVEVPSQASAHIRNLCLDMVLAAQVSHKERPSSIVSQKVLFFSQLSTKLLLAISYSSVPHFLDEYSDQPNLLVQRRYPRQCPFESGTAVK
ncbi:hypothetical protein STEG23_015852, partial [Scotinomys teguina]